MPSINRNEGSSLQPQNIDSDSTFDSGNWSNDKTNGKLFHRIEILYDAYVAHVNNEEFFEDHFSGLGLANTELNRILVAARLDWCCDLLNDKEFAYLVDAAIINENMKAVGRN